MTTCKYRYLSHMFASVSTWPTPQPGTHPTVLFSGRIIIDGLSRGGIHCSILSPGHGNCVKVSNSQGTRLWFLLIVCLSVTFFFFLCPKRVCIALSDDISSGKGSEPGHVPGHSVLTISSRGNCVSIQFASRNRKCLPGRVGGRSGEDGMLLLFSQVSHGSIQY